MIYFTADEHYSSQRALELSKRPFKNVGEMNDCMVENFNSIVRDKDLTIHVGDFGNYNILKRLNGKHYIILGNYEQDEFKKNYANVEDGSLKYIEYLKSFGFLSVSMHAVTNFPISDPSGNNIVKCYITHKPEDCIKDGSVFNLFGHIHGRQMIKRYGLDVGVDAHHFRPLSEADVLFYKEAIEKHYDNNVFE